MIGSLPSANATLWSIKLPQGMKLSDLASQSLKIGGEIKIGSKTFALERMEGGHNVLVFGDNKDMELQPSQTTVSEQLQLVEKVPLPKIEVDKVNVPKPIVAKVDGLHQRWHAPGYVAEDYGLEGSGAPAPKKTKEVKKGKKRSQDDAEAEEPSQKKQKKDKKEKKDKKDKKDKKEKKTKA